MRLSRFPLSTTRETPADAEIVSHRLMLRAGMIRKLGAGIYAWLPLGLRVLRKVERIVREEMDRAGAQELLMPAVIPAELWQESGRWEKYGPELLRLRDRHERDFVIGPTHEEVITDLVRRDVRSYKQLPVNFYQIQTKFRDEIRPRFGVMRGREFIMKDAYSFHLDEADLRREYQNMREAYTRIFTRIGVDFRIVKADSGAIGGDRSEEFHVLAQSGEDLLAVSDGSDYAANVEAAETPELGPPPKPCEEKQEVETPGKRTCEEVAEFLGIGIEKTVKCIAIIVDGRFFLLALRGDRQANEVKIRNVEGLENYRLASDEEIQTNLQCRPGYIGPVLRDTNRVMHFDERTGASTPQLAIICDCEAAAMSDFVCGANADGFHLKGVNWERDTRYEKVADLRNVVEGDPSPDGQGRLRLVRGIEVGHVFQLGRKYTEAMGVRVQGEQGQEIVPESGCYGIGVSRIVAAVIEQRHDEAGIVWPQAIAPFELVIVPIGYGRSEAVRSAANALYAKLDQAGVEVLLDDRDLRPGVMFADAELIGIPHRVVVGDKGLAESRFEYKSRQAAAPEMIAADAAAVLERLRR